MLCTFGVRTLHARTHMEVIVWSAPVFGRMIYKLSRQQAPTLLTMSKTLNHWILISRGVHIWAESDLHGDRSWLPGTTNVPQHRILPLLVVILASIPHIYIYSSVAVHAAFAWMGLNPTTRIFCITTEHIYKAKTTTLLLLCPMLKENINCSFACQYTWRSIAL